MALPQGIKLRKGDIVALHATVKYDDMSDGNVFLDVPGSSMCVAGLDQIASIIRFQLSKGDKVVLSGGNEILTVEATSEDGKFVWVRSPQNELFTSEAAKVQRAYPEVDTTEDPDFAEIETPPSAPEDWDNPRSEKGPADRIETESGRVLKSKDTNHEPCPCGDNDGFYCSLPDCPYPQPAPKDRDSSLEGEAAQ